MKIEIKIEKNNPFMKRKELIIEIDHEGGATPTKASVQKEIAKMKNVKPEHIDIRKIFSKRGIAKSEAKVFIWEEPKVKDLSKEAEKKEQKEEKEKEQPEEKKAETEKEKAEEQEKETKTERETSSREEHNAKEEQPESAEGDSGANASSANESATNSSANEEKLKSKGGDS